MAIHAGHVLIDNTGASADDRLSEARVDDPAIDSGRAPYGSGEEGLRSSSSRMKRPVAGCGRGSPTTSRSALRSGRSPTHSSPSTRVTKSTSLRRRRSSPQRNERTSIACLATLFAATFLFRIGNAVAALALPWFVLSHTKSAAWAGATAWQLVSRPSSARGLVVASSIGSGARPSH